MAVLPEEQRQAVADALGREFSELRIPCGVTKPDIRDAINAADAWLEANAASFNAALPQPVRGVFNARQKALLLSKAALGRALNQA